MGVRALAVSMAGGIMLLSITVPAAADTTVEAELVPQNKSGVRGSVTMRATDSGDLVVRIEATGLMPGPHAQHIHGAAGAGHFQCASLRDDADRDGWLTNEEA